MRPRTSSCKEHLRQPDFLSNLGGYDVIVAFRLQGIMKRIRTSLLRWGWRMQSTVPALRAWRLEFDPRHKRRGDEIIIPVLGGGDSGFLRLAAQPDKPTQQIQGSERPCLKYDKTKKEEPGMVVHTTFNSSPGKSEASGSVSSRPACVNT